AALEAVDVAQEVVLAAVAVEHGVGEVGAGAGERAEAEVGAGGQLVDVEAGGPAGEDLEQGGDLLDGAALVERDADAGGVDGAQVVAPRERARVDDVGGEAPPERDGEGVEEGRVADVVAEPTQAGGEGGGEGVDAGADLLQAL